MSESKETKTLRLPAREREQASGLVRMVTTSRHCYQGKWLNVGDEFECSEADADDLVAVRRAVKKQQQRDSATTYRRRDMQADGGE